MAQFLRSRGQQAYALRGGVAAWMKAGLPTETRRVEARHTPGDICPDCGLPLSQHRHA